MTRVPDGVVDAMLAALQRCRSVPQPASKLCVLIDGALLRSATPRTQRRWPVDAARSLFLSGIADTAAAVGPLLFELPADQPDRAAVESLIDLTTGQMLGSFLVMTNQDADAVEVLRQFVDVQLDDGTEMVMRFYDPRILPFWLSDLSDAYRGHLGTAVSLWLYWAETLEVRVMELSSGSRHRSGPETSFPVRLSAQQETALINASTPYLVMNRLRAEEPDRLSGIPHVHRYDFIRQQLERAAEHGVSALSDLEAYCGLAVALGARFDNDPAMDGALRSVKAGVPFGQAITTLSEIDWLRMRDAGR
jgi:hypothetical protein